MLKSCDILKISKNFAWNEYLVLAGTMIINFVTEYLYDRFFVFGKSIDTAKKEKNLLS